MGCFGRRGLHETTNSEETQPLLRILERPHETSRRKRRQSVRHLEGLRVLEYQLSFTELSDRRRYAPVNAAHGIRSSDCRRGRAIAGRIAHRAIFASSREGGGTSLTAAALICSFSSNAVGASRNRALTVICKGVAAATPRILVAPAPAPSERPSQPEAAVNWVPSSYRTQKEEVSHLRGRKRSGTVRCILPMGAFMITAPPPRRAPGCSTRPAYQSPRCRKLASDQEATIRTLSTSKSLIHLPLTSASATRRSGPCRGKMTWPDLPVGRTTKTEIPTKAPAAAL